MTSRGVVSLGCAVLSASAALGLLVASATSCEFLDVNARDGEILAILETSEQTAQRETSIGVFCQGDFYDLEDDPMWKLSSALLAAGMGLGGVVAALTVLQTCVIAPTKGQWRAISILSAINAVVLVPSFLIFESYPCADFSDRQSCSMSMGAFFLIASDVFWIILVMVTQFLDPPLRGRELEAWLCYPKNGAQKSRNRGFFSRRGDRNLLPYVATASLGEDDGVEEHVVSSADDESQNISIFTAGEKKNDPKTTRVQQRGFEDVEEDLESRMVSIFTAGRQSRHGKPYEEDKVGLLDNQSVHEWGVNDAESISRISRVSGNESILDREPEDTKIGLLHSVQADKIDQASSSKVPGRPDEEKKACVPWKKDKSEVHIIPDVPDEPRPVAKSRVAGVIGKVRRRKPQAYGAYALMDDDGRGRHAFPLSTPPIEIVTINDSEDASRIPDEMPLAPSMDEDEQTLLDDWNELHAETLREFQTESAKDFPVVPNTPHEFGAFDEFAMEAEVEGFVHYATLQENNPKAAIERAAKKRRQERGTGDSLTSSLLDETIEEETDADIQEILEDLSRGFTAPDPVDSTTAEHIPMIARTRSAPNLAGLPAVSKKSESVEDLNMTGIHSFHRVEMFRSYAEPKKQPRSDPRPPLPSRSRSRSRSERGRSLSATRLDKQFNEGPPSLSATRLDKQFNEGPPSPNPAQRTNIWRTERAARESIHAPVSISSSDDSNAGRSYDSAPNRVRETRIRRLQSESGEAAPLRRSRSLEPGHRGLKVSHPSQTSDARSERLEVLSRKTDPGRLRRRVSLSPERSVSTNKSPGNSQTSNDSSIRYDSSYVLDNLDASLAQLHRPIDAEYGPDESSI